MGWHYNVPDATVQTTAPTLVGVGIAMTTLSFLIVSLRCYVRLWLLQKFGMDDYLIVGTWFCSLGFCIVSTLQSKWGLGLVNVADLPLENLYDFMLYQYAGAPFYITSILGFKLSLLFSFYRIAIERAHRIVIVVVMALCVAFHFCFLVVQINLCTPVNKQWDPAVVGGSCVQAVPFYTSMASITILFDIVIMALPFPVLIKTQIPLQKKLILCALFSLGTFITIIQIIRIQTIHALVNLLQSSGIILWSMVENNIGIIIASIPPLSPLVRHWKEKSTGGSSSGRRGGASYAMGTMGGALGTNHGRVRLTSANDRGMRGGEDGKVLSSTTVKVSSFRGGDNSSEEFIFDTRNSTRPDQIRATTEVTVEREDEESVDAGRRGNPFRDPRGLRETEVAHAV